MEYFNGNVFFFLRRTDCVLFALLAGKLSRLSRIFLIVPHN
jgi:hypothetical protein